KEYGELAQLIDERYISGTAKGRKGVSQLAHSIRRIVQGEWTTNGIEFSMITLIYPVLVLRDTAMSFLGFPEYLNEGMKRYMQWAEHTDTGWVYEDCHRATRIAHLIILCVDDVELLAQPGVPKTNRLSCADLLTVFSDYDSRYRRRERSFRDFIVTSPTYKGAFFSNSLLVQKKNDLLERFQKHLKNRRTPRGA
ncbi:hypothetical protein AMJ85_08680, partial [candidate division BRC1 bacterium SM23_51]